VTCPIRVLESQSALDACAASMSARVRHWIDAEGFRFASGAHLAIRDENGRPVQVLICITPGRELWQFAAAAATLPPAEYFVEGAPDSFNGEAAAFGWWQGQYRFDRYKSNPHAGASSSARLAAPAGVDEQRLRALIAATQLALDLVNAPANMMRPEDLAKEAQQLAARFDAKVSLLCGEELLQHNYPLIHAVGRASSHAPCLIDLRWGESDAPKLTIIGKGVCFDAGGLNLKTSDDMLLMKKDMAGAAQALALAQFIMSRNLAVRLRLLIPAVENSVSGNAYRPLDIIRARNGTSIEIGDTDAEGRLILADALAAAMEDEPHMVVDFATLTSATTAALGPEIAGFFSNVKIVDKVLVGMGARTQDHVWPLPLHPSYREMLCEGAGDLTSALPFTGAKPIVAALFLESFVSKATAWLHVDFFGWNSQRRPGRPVGAETHGLRALASYLEHVYTI
jgi:leucyl aminopeptidase